MYLLVELLIVEETFVYIINSNKNHNFEWSIYCHVRLSNEMSAIKSNININIPQFITKELPNGIIYISLSH